MLRYPPSSGVGSRRSRRDARPKDTMSGGYLTRTAAKSLQPPGSIMSSRKVKLELPKHNLDRQLCLRTSLHSDWPGRQENLGLQAALAGSSAADPGSEMDSFKIKQTFLPPRWNYFLFVELINSQSSMISFLKFRKKLRLTKMLYIEITKH